LDIDVSGRPDGPWHFTGAAYPQDTAVFPPAQAKKAKITTIPAKNHLVFWVKIRYGETENNRLGKGKPFCTVKQSACTAGALSVRRALSPFLSGVAQLPVQPYRLKVQPCSTKEKPAIRRQQQSYVRVELGYGRQDFAVNAQKQKE